MTTALQIPLRANIPAQSVSVTLDGRRYRLQLDWIGRIRRWSFSLATESGTSIVRSKGLVLGADLLKRSRHNALCPQGALILTDLQQLEAEATIDSLGVRHVLYYIPRSEFS